MTAPGRTSLAACRVGIAGLGLMGGSLALALRGKCRELVGHDRSRRVLERARCEGVVDRGFGDLRRWLEEVDFAVLAMPVGGILEALAVLRDYEGPPRHVMDLGSAKRAIARAMAALPPVLGVIGGHPMCGKERGGLASAEAGLFRGRPFVLVPLPRTPPSTQRLARSLVRAAGARPLVLDAARHDRAAARISHAPYLVAAALVEAAAGDETARRLAASGFRDLTRVAASDATMMLDALQVNRDATVAALRRVRRLLADYERTFVREGARGLARRLGKARAAKLQWFR